MSTTVRRPTENAAVGRTRQPSYSLPSVLADMTTANRLGDREGMLLLACRAVRATQPEVGK
ncbi:hypothetical protein PV755_46680 [Streptomyces caniscabiei]|uniref:Uncharacterized protein n=1 Tax=Streptomyces caniscabiei TaxID=2746961 RepID=A0A927LG31_9ACTN|nr:hypothetical protein [Streptomyces caniscabiei]MBD9730209.1 hypothetical protein [Streptomyces caniscabiei]MDX3516290.1 hypothetical protein [Streptomyces caniscabiei]MDX3725313.1 hypothetical protein [Streptomyces caniscabiei]WEO25160.1 hypothetical protein IHE65_19350 [Streptomyces caniscabiei]WEO26312.1 hypothetical protein IHE65_25875 [Streptomyces caniscabiei]